MKKIFRRTAAAMFAAIMCVGTACAQEENGFKKFEVRDDFNENGFEWFHNAEILAAGNKEKHNAMTASVPCGDAPPLPSMWQRNAIPRSSLTKSSISP